MEDWEQFFADKSQRRAEKERERQRTIRLQIIGVAVALVAVIAAIGSLATR